MNYLIKLLQFIQQQGYTNKTKNVANVDLGFEEREIAAGIFGTVTLKIRRKKSSCCKTSTVYGNVGGSQQETYKHGIEISNGRED
jgi:hypothetical protein